MVFSSLCFFIGGFHMDFIMSHLSIIFAAIVGIYILRKFLSCGIFTLIGNIIIGGILYYLIDALHIVRMSWSFIDWIIIAFFGTPGTIFLALWHAFF